MKLSKTGISRKTLLLCVGTALFFPTGSFAQEIWKGCAANRDVAEIVAQANLAQGLGSKSISGSERLANNRLRQEVHETSEIVLQPPPHVVKEYRENNQFCVEIAK